MTTGEKVKQARIAKGLAQDYIAARLGISKSAVSRCELGQRQFRVDQLYTLANLLDVPPYELVNISPEKKEELKQISNQAEHDAMASAILITPDESLAAETVKALYRQLETLSRKEIIEQSLDTYGAVILTENMDEAVEFANLLAPEHLEVCCDNPFEYLGRLDNAGSLFLGHYSPEPLGDYFAGPNHVLPTGGTARFFSPLSVDDFVKKSGFVYYPKKALLDAAEDIILLAETEELTAHANSVRVRKDS